MNILSSKLYKYTLNLKSPILVHGTKINFREGLILQLNSEEAHGLGEIAPLPGLSHETLQEALEQTQALRASIFTDPIPQKAIQLQGYFEEWLGELPLKPSVRFGLEMAVLNLFANSKQKPLRQIITKESHNQIHIHGLLQGTTDNVAKEAKNLIEKGYISLKLKVTGNIKEDIEKVKAVDAVINGKALLHLDANQSWDLQKAETFSKEVSCAAVEYVEEPLKNIKEIPEFFNKTTIPVALDESLMNLSLDKVKSLSEVDILVLKPTIIGGIEKTWKIMQGAQQCAMHAVISSSFESNLGILTLANLAGTSRRDISAGLDTSKWFKDDLLCDKLHINHGKIDIENRLATLQDLNTNLLTELS